MLISISIDSHKVSKEILVVFFNFNTETRIALDQSG